jgi:hypothetical protein
MQCVDETMAGRHTEPGGETLMSMKITCTTKPSAVGRQPPTMRARISGEIVGFVAIEPPVEMVLLLLLRYAEGIQASVQRER